MKRILIDKIHDNTFDNTLNLSLDSEGMLWGYNAYDVFVP